MKKLFLGLAALSLLVVASSCGKEATESANDGKDQLTFKAALGKQTKATEFSDWAVGEGFTVYAYGTGTGSAVTPFDVFALEKTAAGWTYTANGGATSVDQPGEALRYYAWYPTTISTTPTATDASYSFGYTVAADPDDQEDLVGATVTTRNSAVTLQFGHLLSQVNFAVMGMEDVKIEISAVTVDGVIEDGIYDFANGWTLGSSNSTSYEYGTTPDPFVANDVTGIQYMGNGGAVYTNDNALMLMPQTFTTQLNGTFSFHYKLSVLDTDGVAVEVFENDVTAYLCDFETVAWAAGKRYVYLIDFTYFLAGGPIVFTVNVTPWVNDDDATLLETLYVSQPNLQSVNEAIAAHSATNDAGKALGTPVAYKVFPIAVPDALSANIVVTYIPGFDAGDKINIEFVDATSMGFFNIDLPGWTMSPSGRVATLTCTAPLQEASFLNIISDPATNLPAALLAFSGDNTSESGLNYFPINLQVPIATGSEIVISKPTTDAYSFQANDVISIQCPDVATTANISFEDIVGWTKVVYGKVILFKKN